jgi:hypothetical protein
MPLMTSLVSCSVRSTYHGIVNPWISQFAVKSNTDLGLPELSGKGNRLTDFGRLNGRGKGFNPSSGERKSADDEGPGVRFTLPFSRVFAEETDSTGIAAVFTDGDSARSVSSKGGFRGEVMASRPTLRGAGIHLDDGATLRLFGSFPGSGGAVLGEGVFA